MPGPVRGVLPVPAFQPYREDSHLAITVHTGTDEVPEQTELATGASRFRDEFQQSVDADVAALKAKAEPAGYPIDPAKLFHRYIVDPADKVALKQVIRRAATLHKVGIVFYRDVRTKGGHVAVKFHVTAPPAKGDDAG
jgi:hypothetical protein